MQCPTCNSDNVQKLQVIFEGGTSHSKGISHTTGGAFGSGFGGGVARTTTNTTTQSIAARRVSPPAKKSYVAAIVLFIAGFIAIKFLELGLIGVALIGVGGWLGYVAFTFNKDKWPGAYNLWQKSWQCNKCGNIYAN